MTTHVCNRLSAEASDHLMQKQLAAYSLLVDTTEEKRGNRMDLSCTNVSMHYLLYVLFYC